MSDVLYSLIGIRRPICPNEADILAYSESTLPQSRHNQLENHFAGCEGCREALGFLGRGVERGEGEPSDSEVTEQTRRVINYIRDDEIKPTSTRHARPALEISYPRLATVGLVLCAIAAAAVFLIIRQQQGPNAAMEAYLTAVKDKRYQQARVSGGQSYSPYQSPSRGDDAGDHDLNLDRALLKLKPAEQEAAPTVDRLLLARVYLARGDREGARHALAILEQLASRGVETPEALNDTGVAHFQLEQYQDAIAYFTRALAKSPNIPEALFNRALAEQRAHLNDEAKRDWLRFLDQSTDENWKNEARVLLKDLGADDQ